MNKEQEKFFITEEFYLTNVEDKKITIWKIPQWQLFQYEIIIEC